MTSVGSSFRGALLGKCRRTYHSSHIYPFLLLPFIPYPFILYLYCVFLFCFCFCFFHLQGVGGELWFSGSAGLLKGGLHAHFALVSYLHYKLDLGSGLWYIFSERLAGFYDGDEYNGRFCA